MLTAGSGWAQSTNISTLFHSNFRKAEIFYKKLAYRNAIELYMRELEKKPANTMAKLRIADSYRVLENLSRAEEWYKKAFEEDIPDSYYMYDLPRYYHQTKSILKPGNGIINTGSKCRGMSAQRRR